MRLIIACGFVFGFLCLSARDADSLHPRGDDTQTFSAKDRQADLARLRNFVYPQGYSDETIVSLENDKVPDGLPVEEYARLHCGESTRFVLHPCILRYAQKGRAAYYVIAQDGNRRFTDLKSAAAYYRDRVSDTTAHFEMEVSVMNMFIDEFCAQIAAGARPRDILEARGGDRPRINHPIAPTDPTAKYQFSTLLSSDTCADCVGIIAVNQPMEAPPPTCGALRKQSVPHLAYFVVSRTLSKGHRSLDDSIDEFTRLAVMP